MLFARIVLNLYFAILAIAAYSQPEQNSAAFKALDKTFFTWKEFSFAKSWTQIEAASKAVKLAKYPKEYYSYFCPDISDSSKSYTLTSEGYRAFEGLAFDHAFLNVRGSQSSFNVSALYFVREFGDSAEAVAAYSRFLKRMKTKYGNQFSQLLEKGSPADSVIAGSYISLSDDSYFSSIESTKWEMGENIFIHVDFMHENNLLVLTVSENWDKALFHPNARNWLNESDYEEIHTAIFKEFDKKNVFKSLQFGTARTTVAAKYRLGGPNDMNQYQVSDPNLKSWFYTSFEECALSFNKKGLLYNATLSKTMLPSRNTTLSSAS